MIRSNFVSMIGIMVVEKNFSKKEAKEIVSRLSPEDIASIVSCFERDIKSETDSKKKYKCWQDLENFIKEYCTKAQTKHTRASYEIAEAVLNLEGDCKKAWDIIKPFVGYTEYLSIFYIRLIPEKKSSYSDAIWDNPETILDIVNTVTSDTPQRYAMDYLGKVLDLCANKDPKLKKSEASIRLLNIKKKFG